MEERLGGRAAGLAYVADYLTLSAPLTLAGLALTRETKDAMLLAEPGRATTCPARTWCVARPLTRYFVRTCPRTSPPGKSPGPVLIAPTPSLVCTFT